MPTPITLKVFRGSELVRTERFDRQIIKIGRLPSTHLCLQDEKISRIHSAIQVSPDGSIAIVDMGSAAGTFVNGKRVVRSPLRHGDQIELGGLTIVVAGDGDDGATPARGGASRAVVPKAELEPPAEAQREPPKEPPRALIPAADATQGRNASPLDEDLTHETDVGVEVRIAWGGVLLQADTFVRPKEPVLVGETGKCAMRLEGLPVSELPMLRWEDGEYRFTFPRGKTGVVEEKGARTTFSDLVESHAAVGDDWVESAYSIAIPRAGAVRAEVGSRLSIEMRPKKLQSVEPAPIWGRINYQFVNLLLVLSFLQAGFILAAYNFPYDTDVVADDLLANSAHIARFVLEPPAPRPRLAGRQREETLADSENGARHEGEEGQAGRERAPRTNGRRRPRAIDPNEKDVATDSGLVGILRRGAGLPTVFGSGGLGGDLQASVGALTGPVVADSHGFGGLGMRGTGTGGGGFDSIRIGAIGTKGLGRGIREGSLDVTRKRVYDPSVEVTPDVRGSLDKELIRKVIQEHAAQIRYCYEQQLAINPRLHGKVAIRWTIQGDGSATDAKVDDSATTLDDRRVHECMMSRITSWTFPRPRGGGVAIVTYPWVLRISGDQ